MNEDCLKLTAYFGERQRVGRRFYADVLLDLFGEYELATSILLRGLGGFGLRHHLRSDQSLSMSEDPSVVAIGVDSRERIEKVLERLLTVKRRGLLTLERARLLRDEIGPVSLPSTLDEATKLTIHMGRQERVDGAPAYRAVCDLLHQRGIAGASVLVGVDGTLHGDRQRAHFFDGNSQVPTMAIAVGSGERIAGRPARARRPAQAAVDHGGAHPGVQARRAAAGAAPPASRRRRARARHLAEDLGTHFRVDAVPGRADPPGVDPPPETVVHRPGRHRRPWHLGIPRGAPARTGTGSSRSADGCL